MPFKKILYCVVFVAAFLGTDLMQSLASEPAWSGEGSHRMLVRVKPVDLGERTTDEMPAELRINLSDMLARAGIGGTADISSIQVMKYDLESGKALAYENYAYGRSPHDRPFRWYDGAIDYEFPEWEGYLTHTDGKYVDYQLQFRTRWGYFYDCIGDWRQGNLAWTHSQEGQATSYYAIYFDLLQSQSPHQVPPRGFLGDGLNRCEPVSQSTTGLAQSRLDVDDWNDDGLLDLVVGCWRGAIVWYPNLGSKTEPKFVYSKLIYTSDGRPIDTGSGAAPKIVDWDSDGKKDLIIGCERNRVAYYKNMGSNKERRLVYQGVLQADNEVLIIPYEPCPEGLSDEGVQVYPDDYFPILETVDWDDDGDTDLLSAGFITGMIFYFENTGPDSGGVPTLKFRGPVHADGQPLDVEWAAAPTVVDFDADGDLDLVTGSTKMTKGGGGSASTDHFLHYFENTGSRAKPVFTKKPFPKEGTFPRSSYGTPRGADLNNDGVLDLILSARMNIYLYWNRGTPEAPIFEVHSTHLPTTWGASSLALNGQFIDWNNDGRADLFSEHEVQLNTGQGSPGIFQESFSIVPPGQEINMHSSGKGDDWRWPRVYDLDSDGDLDFMNADHGGHIWFHENAGSNEAADFDTKGIKLQQVDGKEIKVGPEEGRKWDYDVLQGSRAKFVVADLNNDSHNDIVVGDTFGIVRYYENASRKDELVFALPVIVGKLPNRCAPIAIDWNDDGWLDIIANTSIDYLYIPNAGHGKFAPAEKLKLPSAPYNIFNMASVDFNGDGDDDIVFSTQFSYTVWVEKSFVNHGYARGEFLGLEAKPDGAKSENL